MAEKRRKDNKGRVPRKGEYQRADGTYAYDYKNPLGKRETIYAPTFVELRERENLITKDVLDGIDTSSSRLTVNDLYERWKPIWELDVKAGILRERTFHNYCYMYEMFVMPDFGNKIAKDVTSPMVSAFYKTLITERGLKPNSIANVHVPLTQVFDYGVDSRILRYNPCHGVMRRMSTTTPEDTAAKAARCMRSMTPRRQRECGSSRCSRMLRTCSTRRSSVSEPIISARVW